MISYGPEPIISHLAFVDGFDNAHLLKHDLERILGRTMLLLLTDSQLLFDALTRSRYLSERRLIIDIASAREAYLDGIISNVEMIKPEYNAAEDLTNIPGNGGLHKLLQTYVIDHPVEQYVIHSSEADRSSQASKRRK